MTFNPIQVDIPKLYNYLNASESLLNWHAPGIPGSVFLVSQLNLVALTARLTTHMNGLLFILAEASPHSVNGALSSESWGFIANPPEIAPKQEPALKNLGLGGLLGNALSPPRSPNISDTNPFRGALANSLMAPPKDKQS